MKSATLQDCLRTIDHERETVFARLDGICQADVWQRPGNGRWSIGQNLEHLAKTMGVFRWVFALTYPVGLPFAVPFRRQSFARDVANPYEPRAKPVSAPPGVRPRDRQTSPVPLEELHEKLQRERRRFEAAISGMDEAIAGHIKIWDPPVGMVNLLQLGRLVAHHEAHHLRSVHKLLDSRMASAGSS